MKILKLIYIIPFLLLALAFNIQKDQNLPPIKIDKQTSALNVDLNFLKFATSPYTLLTTDLLWITTLMESDLEHYKEKDLNSWMFLRFKSITELDPHFLRAYQFGGQYLNIIKDDLEGSSYIFEKGLEVYPNNYELISDAAFLYAFEYERANRAIELYTKALTFPQAPDFFHSILTKLKYSESLDAKDAFLYLKKVYENTSEGAFKAKIQKDLYSLKATVDLECLNQKKINCDRYDFKGQPYLYKNGGYTSQDPILEVKLFKRK